MHILGISGSPRRGSAAANLLRAVASIGDNRVTVTIYESLIELPHFSPELDIEPAPERIAELRRQLRDADAIIICTPEYAFSMPSVLKNALEWSVSSGELNTKPTATISTSPLYGGGELAHQELLMVLKTVGAKIPEDGSVTVRNTRKRITAEGTIVDPELERELHVLLEGLLSLARSKADE